MSQNKSISAEELAKHNTREDCWVAIHGKVYDLTTFLNEHPAGANVILKQAGKDGTKAFEPYHASDIITTLGKQHLCVGVFDASSQKQQPNTNDTNDTNSQPNTSEPANTKPALASLLNVYDFEVVAKTQMSPEGWAYYSSGADDEITLRENHAVFSRVWLKPRVLRNVKNINMSTTVLGFNSSFPLYITATALAKLAHPDGEVALTRACHKEKIIQMIPTLGSCSLEEITGAKKPGQVQFFQLYVNSNRAVTEELVRRAEKGGCKALFVTVDAPVLGKREKDMRFKFVDEGPSVQGSNLDRNQGTARAISSFIDPSLNWDDIAWLKSITSMPIVLKGVQCGEDALKALHAGVAGIVVSNHGGRQLDCSRSGLEVLEEVASALKQAGVDLFNNTDSSRDGVRKFEVFLDGGVRRGADIFKALALGARAVGIGRPTLYGLASYGEEGVVRVLQLLKDELEMCMRLMGTPTVADIGPQHLSLRSLTSHTAPPAPGDALFERAYEPLLTQLEINARSKL